MVYLDVHDLSAIAARRRNQQLLCGSDFYKKKQFVVDHRGEVQ